MPATELRREAIRRILLAQRVAHQHELLDHLGRMNIRATQPVISRDLRVLKVAKRDGFYTLAEPEKVTPLESLRSLLRDAKAAGPHLVIVRCEPGAASAVARAIEAAETPGLVGTVAGDDTIFAAVSSDSAGKRLRRRIAALI